MWVRTVFLHHCLTEQLSAQLHVFLSDLFAAITADGYNLYTVDENKEVPYTCFLLLFYCFLLFYYFLLLFYYFLLLFYYFLHANNERLESTNKQGS